MSSVTLKDDGLSGDRLAGDGIYGGLIPAQANGSIVAFQVAARTSDGRAAAFPRPPAVATYPGFQGPYCLYGVDDAPPPADGSATYRILIARAELAALEAWYTQGTGDEYMRFFTNKLFHCTFVADGKVYLGDEDGDVVVMQAGREKKILAEPNMGSPVYSTVVTANGVMFIMTRNNLYAIQEGAQLKK